MNQAQFNNKNSKIIVIDGSNDKNHSQFRSSVLPFVLSSVILSVYYSFLRFIFSSFRPSILSISISFLTFFGLSYFGLPVRLSITVFSSVCHSIHPSIHPSVYPFLGPFVCLLFHSYVNFISVFSSFRLFVCLFFRQSIDPSILFLSSLSSVYPFVCVLSVFHSIPSSILL